LLLAMTFTDEGSLYSEEIATGGTPTSQ